MPIVSAPSNMLGNIIGITMGDSRGMGWDYMQGKPRQRALPPFPVQTPGADTAPADVHGFSGEITEKKLLLS
jgi:hypothetical protein